VLFVKELSAVSIVLREAGVETGNKQDQSQASTAINNATSAPQPGIMSAVPVLLNGPV
jgi:hypothetical protein